MAITDNDSTFQPQQPPAQKPNFEPRTQQQGQGWSFHDTRLFGAPISRGIGSEAYAKLKTNLIEVYKQANENIEIALIDLDNENEPMLEFSSLIVAARFKDKPEIGVAYHILILESTSERLSPIMESIGNEQVKVLRVTSDALDIELATKAEEHVRRAFPQGPWYMVDGCVVPRNFNPDDKYSLHALALNAGLAVNNELEVRSPGFNDMNLGVMQKDSSLTASVAINRHQVINSVGKPMRSDVIVSFGSKKLNGQTARSSINTGDKDIKLSECSGFIDLVWAPSVDSQGFNPFVTQNQPAKTQKYAARLVLTNMQSNYSYTIASTLLSLYSAVALAEDNNWIQAFRPSANFSGKVDMTDIGAINIDANLYNEPSGFGTRIDTKSDGFRLAELGQLMTALVQPSMMVSLDCPEVDAQTWYTSIFASASNGSEAAYRLIYEAAMTLTNGNFERYFPKGTPMFTDIRNRIHLGTYVSADGTLRDIRDFDYLAVCNLVGESNPTIIRDWSDTFYRTQYPIIQRLAAREKMITAFSNETAEFTGFAERVTFTGAFMDALVKGIRDTGLNVRTITPLSSAAFSDQRGVANFANSALLTPGRAFVQAGGFGTQQGRYPTGTNWRY